MYFTQIVQSRWKGINGYSRTEETLNTERGCSDGDIFRCGRRHREQCRSHANCGCVVKRKCWRKNEIQRWNVLDLNLGLNKLVCVSLTCDDGLAAIGRHCSPDILNRRVRPVFGAARFQSAGFQHGTRRQNDGKSDIEYDEDRDEPGSEKTIFQRVVHCIVKHGIIGNNSITVPTIIREIPENVNKSRP